MSRVQHSKKRGPAPTVRPAVDKDVDVLWGLHRSAMRPVVTAIWGWDEDVQATMFRDSFDAASLEVIELDGRPIGMLAVRHDPEAILIATIEIAPEFQRRGLGSMILRDLLVQGDAAHVPIRLQVLRANDSARRLYERLGFAVSGDTPTHVLMERQPSGSMAERRTRPEAGPDPR